MSSRKMSLSGCRPARVTSTTRSNRVPALGPRFTTRRPAPLGRSGSVTVSSSSAASPWESTGCSVTVVSAGAPDNTAPHEEQKFAPAGLRCPQLLQNTRSTLVRPRSAPAGLLGDELRVPGRVEQPFRGLRRIADRDHTDPPGPVWVRIELLGRLLQRAVHFDDLAGHRCVDLR